MKRDAFSAANCSLRLGTLLSAMLCLSVNNGCALSHPTPAPQQTRGETQQSAPDFLEFEYSPEATLPLDTTSSFDEFVRYALYNNPELQREHQIWRALAARSASAGALPDPRLRAGYFLEQVETRVGPQEARFGIDQMLPWPGLLEGKEEAAAAEARAQGYRYQAIQLDVIEELTRSLHELAYLDRSLQIAQLNLELLRSFEGSIRTRYRVGAGTHPELIRVQLALGQLEDKLSQLQLLRPTSVAEVNAVLHRSPNAPLATAPPLPEKVVTMASDELITLALQSNPRLLALAQMEQAGTHRETVARKSGFPDFTIGMEYIVTGSAANPNTRGSGDDPVLFTLGVRLPLNRSKYRAQIDEAEARHAAAMHSKASESDRIATAIHKSWFQHRDAHRRVQLYESMLIPKAEESLQASLTSFRNGATTFLEVLDTERSLLEFAISAERARADRATALAHLRTLTGGVVPTTLVSTLDPSDEPQDNTPKEGDR